MSAKRFKQPVPAPRTFDSGEMKYDLEVYKYPGSNQPRYATVFGINKAKYDWHHSQIAYYLSLRHAGGPRRPPFYRLRVGPSTL